MGQDVSSQEDWDRPRFGTPERHKGFKNAAGENNCFLNVSLQALWHLRSFREPIKEHLSQFDHLRPDDDSVLDCVYSLFTHYQFADATELATTSVRELLAHKYASIDRFQLGQMDDANEALEAILRLIHSDQYRRLHPQAAAAAAAAAAATGDVPALSAPRRAVDDDDQCFGCIAHRVFGSSVVEQSFCLKCGATSEPTVVDLMLHPLYATELIEAVPHGKHSEPFEKLLSQCFRSQPKSCPNNSDEHPERDCPGPAHPRRHFLSTPAVFALSIVWPTTQGSRADIDKILSAISYELDLSKVFDIVPSGTTTELPSSGTPETRRFRRHFRARRRSREPQTDMRDRYRFRGMVLYYGKHYVAIFQSTTTGNWLLFDDARIRSLGNWKQAKEYCLQGTYQPTLLLYERQILGDEAHIPSIHGTDAAAGSRAQGAGSGEPWVFPRLHDAMLPPPQSSAPREPNQTTATTGPPIVDLTRTESPDLHDYQLVANDLLTGDADEAPVAIASAPALTPQRSQDDPWVDLQEEKELARRPTGGAHPNSEPEVILRAKPGPSRPVQYYVEIEPEIYNGKPLLGLRIASDSEGNIFVTDFAPHPQTNKLLPIHRRVELMDRLIEANGRSLAGCSVDDAVTILTSRNDTVSMLLQSSYKTIPSWFCRACGNQNHLTEPAAPLTEVPVVCDFCDKTSMLFVAPDHM